MNEILTEDWVSTLTNLFLRNEQRRKKLELIRKSEKDHDEQRGEILQMAKDAATKGGYDPNDSDTMQQVVDRLLSQSNPPVPATRPKPTDDFESRRNDASPRNVRNNNPGNLRKSPNDWQGKTGDDGEFEIFDTPQNGIRALTKLLYNYQKNYNLNTIAGIITRWAPPSENDTASYISFVASKTGVGADEQINLQSNLAFTKKFVKAIIQKEGSQASVEYFDPYIDSGIAAVN